MLRLGVVGVEGHTRGTGGEVVVELVVAWAIGAFWAYNVGMIGCSL